jgi:hypothetical protein
MTKLPLLWRRIRQIIESLLRTLRNWFVSDVRMERLYTQENRPLSDIAHAAIAVRSVDSKQRHIGVLHREDGSSEVMLLHLAWHHDLRDQLPGPNYLWIDTPISGQRLRQVAAICRKVWRSNQRAVPYAFSAPNDCFDHVTGRFLLGPTRYGLTCVSFVLAVFEAAGLRLIQYEAWRARVEDREWQEMIVQHLETGNPPASADHIAAVRTEIGSARYRPEEVAGAATMSQIPVDFQTACQLGEQVLRQLALRNR